MLRQLLLTAKWGSFHRYKEQANGSQRGGVGNGSFILFSGGGSGDVSLVWDVS